MNQHNIIGRLGKDPESRTLENGNKVCSFSVATDKSWKDKTGDKQTKTTWHNVVVWGKLAEICEKYLKKGSKVYISGESETRSYDDKEGNKRYVTELVGEKMEMLDTRPSGNESGTTQATYSQPQQNNGEIGPEEDLPF